MPHKSQNRDKKINQLLDWMILSLFLRIHLKLIYLNQTNCRILKMKWMQSTIEVYVISLVEMFFLSHHHLKLFIIFGCAAYGIHAMYKYFFLWIHQFDIFRNSACCPLKMNNGLIYKFDHYEDDFSDLNFEYGCRTGNIYNVFNLFRLKISHWRLCLCSAKARTRGYWYWVLL